MAIEYLDFGEGFMVAGPDWGILAQPYLERGDWRRLTPGVHDIVGHPQGANFTRVSVYPGGDGQMETLPRHQTEDDRQRRAALAELLVGVGSMAIELNAWNPAWPTVDVMRSQAWLGIHGVRQQDYCGICQNKVH